jgi:hypothetical protein
VHAAEQSAQTEVPQQIVGATLPIHCARLATPSNLYRRQYLFLSEIQLDSTEKYLPKSAHD